MKEHSKRVMQSSANYLHRSFSVGAVAPRRPQGEQKVKQRLALVKQNATSEQQ
jgi:hypothetical protein